MNIRMAIRGYLGRELKFEQMLDKPLLELDEVLPDIGEQHCHALAEGRLTMIEIEFLDDPDINRRFFRIGTSPEGMVIPIPIDLEELADKAMKLSIRKVI